jgi:SagB-type dehydrogenase family enzyme
MSSSNPKEGKNLFSISELFHESSKSWPYQIPPTGSADLQVVKVFSRPYKKYPTMKRVKLPKEFPDSAVSVEKAIEMRRSIRTFSGEPISLLELSKLISCANGVTGSTGQEPVTFLLRAAPSAGALYPIEMYSAVFNVTGLEKGIYYHDSESDELVLLKRGDYRRTLFEYSFGQDMVLHGGAMFLLTGVFTRTKIKYGERGYRYVLLDAGHIAQNIYLVATAMNLGAVSIGGFFDDYINELLNIDGVEEAALYMVLVGRKVK